MLAKLIISACIVQVSSVYMTSNNEMSLNAIRNLVLQLTVVMGTLSSLFLTMVPSNDSDIFESNTLITSTVANLLRTLMELSSSLTINLHRACCKKMELNCQKYPIACCKVRNCIDRILNEHLRKGWAQSQFIIFNLLRTGKD